MAFLNQRRGEGLPEIKTLGGLDDQESFFAVVAAFCGQTDTKSGQFQELAQAIAICPEDQEPNHLLQIELKLLSLFPGVGFFSGPGYSFMGG
jgi:hypothetical protein